MTEETDGTIFKPPAGKLPSKMDGLQEMAERAKQLVRSHPVSAYCLYFSTFVALLALSLVRIPFVLFEVFNAVGYCVIIAITLAFEWDEQWLRDWKSLSSSSSRSEDNGAVSSCRKILGSIERNRFVTRTIDLCILVLISSHVIRIVGDWYTAGGVWWQVCLSVAAGMVPPGLSLFALWLTQCLKRNVQLERDAQTEVPRRFSLSRFLMNGWTSFGSERLPYLGAYAGCMTFLLFLSLGSYGIGEQIAGWLQSSARAAHIGTSGSPTGSFTVLVSVILAVLLCNTFARLAVRVSAAFHVFAVRLFVHRDSLLDAIFETAILKNTVLMLPDGNTGAKNIFAILQWLATCYSILFFLVAFCPPPLGDAITGWLSASMVNAGIQVPLSGNPGFRLFLASIVAGYGAVPMAVMSCTFLAARKPNFLVISSQGVLCPPSGLDILGFSPMKMWSSLRRLSLRKPLGSKNEILTLHFSWPDKIELELDKINLGHVNELLAAADEYGSRSHFEEAVVELRAKLTKDIKANSLVESNKFSATIFSPHKGGDRLNSGKYRIVRKLAGKSLSVVYLARNEKNQHVVIKEFVVPTAARQQEQMVTSFEREFNILLNLKHPSIAHVTEMFQERDARFIVLEYVPGANLRTIVERKGPRSEKVVRRWSLEIARVMQFLHTQHPPVLHRDLTPDNLMEDLDGNLKLIDFGAAHQFMEGVTGTLIGKQCYIAPEQLRGKPTVRSDIYSFGCTLYFLLTGRDPAALEKSDLSGDSNVSPDLSRLIELCTQFEESQRYHSFDEVISALQGRSAQLISERDLQVDLA